MIERLTVEALPECLDLARDRDWPAEDRKWRLLFEIGAVYGVRDGDGRLAGTVILTRFGGPSTHSTHSTGPAHSASSTGPAHSAYSAHSASSTYSASTRTTEWPSLAVVGMLLVAGRHGRRGLGRALMEHALAEAGEATVFLYATDYGRPLYERLGFDTVSTAYTMVGELDPPAGNGSRPAVESDIPAVRKLDALANGADRSPLVDRLPRHAETIRVVERDGAITGYAGAWRNISNVVIGPVVAEDATGARTLITDVARGIAGPIRVDLDERRTDLREWAGRHGLRLSFTSSVMVYGGRPLPGDRDMWFLPVMQALG